MGIEQPSSRGTKDDTAYCRNGYHKQLGPFHRQFQVKALTSFTDIQLLLDEQGNQHENGRETAQDCVRQMRLVDLHV